MPRSKAKQIEHEKQVKRNQLLKITRSKLRKRIFVANLLNTENTTTWCNYTQSAHATFPKANYKTVANLGTQMMNDNFVKNEIEVALEKMDLTIENRVRVLHDIITGKLTRVSTQEVKNKETGEWIQTTRQVSTPSFKERIDSIRMLNQLDGTEAKSKSIAREKTKLFASMRKKLMASLEDSRKSTLKTIVDKTTKTIRECPGGAVTDHSEAFTTALKQGNDIK